MNLVHPITALYWGPVWVWAYFTRGRKASHDARDIRPWNIGNAVPHCGAGSTLGDVCDLAAAVAGRERLLW